MAPIKEADNPAIANRLETENSILSEWLHNFFEDWLNFADYWRERRRILENPSVILKTGNEGPRRSPLHFATQPVLTLLILASLFFGALRLIPYTKPPQSPERKIERHQQQIAVLKYQQENTASPVRRAEIQSEIQAEEKRLFRARIRHFQFEASTESLKLLMGPYLLLNGMFLRRYLIRKRIAGTPSLDPTVSVSLIDRIYLYYYGAASLWMTVGYVLYMYILDALQNYGIFDAALWTSVGRTIARLIPGISGGGEAAAVLVGAILMMVLIIVIPLTAYSVAYYRIEKQIENVSADLLGLQEPEERKELHRGMIHARNLSGTWFVLMAMVLYLILFVPLVLLAD
ncbi:MAG: hypothetical protein OHK0029_19890 [Armatimonadaceae bacterium]